jgi:endonuclease/exonuclease/phosphatase (EEP) superfamily protein YafD
VGEETSKGRFGVRRMALGAAEVMLLGAGLGTLLAYAGRWSWFLDLLVHFRLQYLLALAVAGCLGALIRVWWVAVASSVLALLNLSSVAPLYFGGGGSASAARIDVVTVNLHAANDRHDAALEWLGSIEADVVFVQELSDHWVDALETAEGFRFAAAHPRRDNFGIGMLVRDDAPVDLFVVEVIEDFEGLPVIEARTGLGGRELSLLSIHAMPPAGASLAEQRGRQLEAAATWATEQRSLGRLPVVVGDLNATPYAHCFDRLLGDAGLADSGQGFGPQGTFPSQLPTRIPVDHVLADPELVTVDRAIGPDIGSDHRAVLATLAVQN